MWGCDYLRGACGGCQGGLLPEYGAQGVPAGGGADIPGVPPERRSLLGQEGAVLCTTPCRAHDLSKQDGACWAQRVCA